MSSSSSSGRKGSMFVPRSVGGRWVMLVIVLWFGWMLITHPSDAVDLLQTIGGLISDLFSTMYQAYVDSKGP